MLLVHHTQGVDFLVTHSDPGAAQAHLAVYSRHAADVHVANLGAHVGVELGSGDVKIVEDKLGLPVEQSGPAGLAGVVGVDHIFQPAVRDGGADGVRIRVTVADDFDLMGIQFLIGHIRLIPSHRAEKAAGIGVGLGLLRSFLCHYSIVGRKKGIF